MRKLMGCDEMPALRPFFTPLSRTIGTNLVKVIELFIRDIEEFASFVLILGSPPAPVADKLHEAKGIVIEVNLPVPFAVGAGILAGL